MYMHFKPLHILVVDDQAIFRQVISSVILEEGAEITEAFSAHQALQFLSSGLVVDGITTDYNMPLMNGIDFVKELRAKPEYSKIPIAMISTENSNSIVLEAEKAGVNVWIDKFSVVPGILQWLDETYSTCTQ